MLPNTYFTDFRDKLRLNDDCIHKIKKEVETDNKEFATKVKAIFKDCYPTDDIHVEIMNYDYFKLILDGIGTYSSDLNCLIMDNFKLDFEVVTFDGYHAIRTEITFYYDGFPTVR